MLKQYMQLSITGSIMQLHFVIRMCVKILPLFQVTLHALRFCTLVLFIVKYSLGASRLMIHTRALHTH